jgi:hypothetical protein
MTALIVGAQQVAIGATGWGIARMTDRNRKIRV